MSKPIPPIQKYMTTTPHSIGADEGLGAADALMRTHSIRHLPVLEEGKLVGILSERDIRLVEALPGVDPHRLMVKAAMWNSVYSVEPDSPLDEVVASMAEHKYGCAVVMQNDKVVGIFTTVDVCRALAELLHTRLAKG